MRFFQFIVLSFIVVFFLPVILQLYIIPTTTNVTYAETEQQPEWKEESITVTTDVPRVLFLFTHSQEAYPGAITNSTSKIPVYHPTNNITAFDPAISQLFANQAFAAESLQVDTMQLLSKQKKSFDQAYSVVRPHLKQQLTDSNYQYVIDFHRDSAGRKVTTLENTQGSFAKLMFIVGGEHPAYASNLKLAEALSKQLETQVPGISRGVLVKRGKGVDGVYNQDLHPNSLLIELGGIDNSPAEVEKSIAEIAEAFRQLHDSHAISISLPH